MGHPLQLCFALFKRVGVDVEDEGDDDVEDDHDCDEEENAKEPPGPGIAAKQAVDIRRRVPIVAHKHREKGQNGGVSVVEV